MSVNFRFDLFNSEKNDYWIIGPKRQMLEKKISTNWCELNSINFWTIYKMSETIQGATKATNTINCKKTIWTVICTVLGNLNWWALRRRKAVLLKEIVSRVIFKTTIFWILGKVLVESDVVTIKFLGSFWQSQEHLKRLEHHLRNTLLTETSQTDLAQINRVYFLWKTIASVCY